ncbi:hypothetical protein HNQ34_000133 [Anoxybacillus tepidamans]|uniref:Uncharacterized protein n=1 Tax=Anoxybacteroides tepidamans TaxID=265948 RepID=A0A7W8IND8_9BACL|nr:hypothetical protein [Anoxybacillus tepidamans]MBB5323056.1 hypothetical protein [Anoxybacillus tepidamans]
MKPIDLFKISQALDNTYMMLEAHEAEGLERIETAKHEWKQAVVYMLSSVFRA